MNDFIHNSMANDETRNKDKEYSDHYGSDGDYNSLAHDASPNSRLLKVGLAVKARYNGMHTWFPGTIAGKNGDGTFHIQYSNGKEETRVKSKMIRAIHTNDEPAYFAEGDEVQCNYKGKGQWLRGGISHVNKGGTYDVVFDNGNEEHYVDSACIRPIRKTRGSQARGKAKKEIFGEYFTAKSELQTRTGEAPTFDNSVNDSDNASKSGTEARDFKVGDEVKGNYKGYGRGFKGRISYANTDGTYNVLCGDGITERGVRPSQLRFSANASIEPSKLTMFNGSDISEFEPGDEIEGNFKGKGRWYRGKVAIVNRDGTYDIHYDDGDRERGVNAYNIRGLRRNELSARGTYKTGDLVKANYKRRGLWLEGKICQVNRDGTYSVRFNDGSVEKDVTDCNLYSFSAPQISSPTKTRRDSSGSFEYDADALAVGDRIEGNYKGKGRWYKGSVARLNIDGTCDLHYDDGDTDKRVAMSYIRLMSDKPSPHTQEEEFWFDKAASADFMEGDTVECNYKGRGRWIEGSITHVNRDGTYDLQFNSKEGTETCVSPWNVRPISPYPQNKPVQMKVAADPQKNKHLKKMVGERIKCNYRGKGKWFTGEILQVNADGTYEVLYDDGNQESSVEWNHIRTFEKNRDNYPSSLDVESGEGLRVKGGSFRKDDSMFQVGDNIEAQFRGRSTWYEGTILKQQKNRTFHIVFANGDEELYVDQHLIRKREDIEQTTEHRNGGTWESDADSNDTTVFNAGEDVQCNHKGKGKWYKCKIERVNKDGTYRVRYGDGRIVDHVSVWRLCSSSTGNSNNKTLGHHFQLGDNVKGNYKRKGLWIRGHITRVNRNRESCDICYKTGIEEYGVTLSNIRSLGRNMPNKALLSHRRSSRGSDNDESDIDGAAFSGDSEGSSFKGKRMWVNGDQDLNFKNHNGGGTQQGRSHVEIDTESDTDASQKLIPRRHASTTSKMPRSSKHSNVKSFKLFDTIVANYKGTGKWERGSICRVCGGGSYDVLYENNKYGRENYVKAHQICFLSHQSEEEEEVDVPDLKQGIHRFRIGDEIEVKNGKGKTKWQRGIIRGVHRDGSYEIEHANGDCEYVSPLNKIRRIIAHKHPKSSQRSVSDSNCEEDRPYQSVSQHPRRQIAFYPKLIESGSGTDSEEFNTSEGAEKKLRELNNKSEMKSESDITSVDSSNSSVCLVSERLWSVLSSAARGGVKVKQAAKGILRKEFESVDKDNDGLITPLQLYKLLRQLDEPILLDEEEVTDLFRVMDYKRNGLVSLRDIVELALSDPKGVDVPIDVLPVYRRLSGEATVSMKLPHRKRISGRGDESGGGSVDRVKCVEDALAGERAPRWSELSCRLARVGVTVRSRDVDVLKCVLDTEDTGRVPSEVFAVWLCSGLDTAMLKLKAKHLLCEVEARGVDPEMVLKHASKQSGAKGRGKTMSEDTFIEGLRVLGMPLTHGELNGLISIFSVEGGEYESNLSEGFDYSQTIRRQRKKEIDVIRFLELSSEQQLFPHDGKPPTRQWDSSKSSPIMESKAMKRKTHRKKGEKHEKSKLNVDISSSENNVTSDGAQAMSPEIFRFESDGCNNQEEEEEDCGNNAALFDRKTLKALRSLAFEDANKYKALRDSFMRSSYDTATTEEDSVLPLKRCEEVLKEKLGSKVSKQQIRTVMEFLSKLQEVERHATTGSKVMIPLLDVVELSLSQMKSSSVLIDLHDRMAEDLATKVHDREERNMLHSKAAVNHGNKEKGQENIRKIISIVTKPFKAFDRTNKGSGFVTSKAFKKGLTKLGCGMLTESEKSYLVKYFDVNKEEIINFEQFGLWLASGLDLQRLKIKFKWLRKILKTKGISLRATLKQLAMNNLGRIDRDKVCQCLCKILGFPLTCGEMRSLLMLSSPSSQSRGGGGGSDIDIDVLLNGITRNGNKLLAQDGHIVSNDCKDGDMFDKGLLGGGKDHRHHQVKNVLLNYTTEKLQEKSHQTGKQGTNETNNTVTTNDKGKVMTKEDHKHSKARDIREKRNDPPQKLMGQLCTNVRVRIQELVDKGCYTDWETKLDKCSGAESGFVSLNDAVGVIVQMGIPVSSSQKAALGKQIGYCNDEMSSGGEPGQSPSLSVRSLVRWLEACSEIDTHLLWNVQRHLTSRLDKSFGIRDLFTGITAGRRYITPKRLTKVLKGTKAQLSRVVIDLLVDIFDNDGDGSLSFPEFQKLVYTKGALRDSAGMSCLSHQKGAMRSVTSSNHWDYTTDGLLWGDHHFSSGCGPDPQAWVDKEVYQIFTRALEKAFMFYDEDNSNTIEVVEIGNILRALGQDPTQKDVRALVRHADKDRNGILSFDEFKDAVMPFIMERMVKRRLTDAEVRATFNSIDCDNSGSISRKEFQNAFVTQLKVLSPLEAETLANLCDRNCDGFISWEEFAEFFQLIEDPDGTLPALIKAEVKGIVHIALMKLSIGAQHDPEDHLLAFLGMPSNFRRSILAGLDLRKEFQLSSLLMPVFDSRGGISMPDAMIKVTTTVKETSTPVGQSSIAQNNKDLVSSGSTFRAFNNKWWKSSPKRMAGKKEFGSSVNLSPRHQEMALPRSGGLSSPSSFERMSSNLSQGHSKKVTMRSTFIGQGQQLTETTVLRSASLQSSYDVESDNIMQVMISVKRGTGIPVPQDSRIKDVIRRCLRVCLVYIPPNEVDGGDTSLPELEDLCLGNTYQTLATQDPSREEIWNFPNGPDGERKFLVRTDFTSPDDPKARENVCVLLELTCTIATEKTQPDDDRDW